MEENKFSSKQLYASDALYDRSFKQRCFEEVLEHYGSFLNVANYPEDIKLIFLLTMCRMIDKAKFHLSDHNENGGDGGGGGGDHDDDDDDDEDNDDNDYEDVDRKTVYAKDETVHRRRQTTDGISLVSRNAPWNLTALIANEQRLFSRYKFDARADEATNAIEFIDQLLDQPDDSTVRFV